MPKLLVKSSVRPVSLLIAAAVINQAAEMNLSIDIVITSGNDSRHMKDSRHYTDEALDVRSKTFPSADSKRAFMAGLRARLGDHFDILLEHEGGAQEHFHIELDPK